MIANKVTLTQLLTFPLTLFVLPSGFSAVPDNCDWLQEIQTRDLRYQNDDDAARTFPSADTASSKKKKKKSGSVRLTQL